MLDQHGRFASLVLSATVHDTTGGVVLDTGGFEPRILGILCNWCSYSGADGAGQARLVYPPNVSVVRVMCSGRVDPAFVLQALAEGMDGVLICGCHPGDCHYLSGNCKAAARFPLLQAALESLGIERERVRLEWVSASESARYAALVGEMVETVRALGPLRFPALSDPLQGAAVPSGPRRR